MSYSGSPRDFSSLLDYCSTLPFYPQSMDPRGVCLSRQLFHSSQDAAHLLRTSLPPPILPGLTWGGMSIQNAWGWGTNAHIIFPLVSVQNAPIPDAPSPEVLLIFFIYISVIFILPVRPSLLLCASEVSAGLNTLRCLIHFYRNNTVIPEEGCHFTNNTLAFLEATLFPFHSESNPLGSFALEEKSDYAKNVNT